MRNNPATKTDDARRLGLPRTNTTLAVPEPEADSTPVAPPTPATVRGNRNTTTTKPAAQDTAEQRSPDAQAGE